MPIKPRSCFFFAMVFLILSACTPGRVFPSTASAGSSGTPAASPTAGVSTYTRALSSTPKPTPISTFTLAPFSLSGLQAISPNNARRIRPQFQIGRGSMNGVSWSPDGKTIAAASAAGIYFLDAQSLMTIRYFEVGEHVDFAEFSPDGTMLVSGSRGYLKLWRVSDGVPLAYVED